MILYYTREGWCVRCACLSRPSGRVGSNDPLSLSSTESSPTSHAKSQRPSNPNRLPMCATEAIGTQIEIRIDRPIASQCAPPWPSEPRSKAESSNQSLPDVRHRGDRNPDRNQNRSLPDVRHRGHGNPDRKQNRATNRFPMCATVAIGTQSLPDVRHRGDRNPDRKQNRATNRFPMCATVAIGTQIETRIDHPIAARRAPPWPWEPRSKAESSNQSLPDVRHRGHRNPIASRCAPPWRSEPRSKPESITQSLPDVRHRGHGNPVRNQNRAANRMPTRTENRHRNRSKIDAKSIPKGSK
jgi:hypothetical protein